MILEHDGEIVQELRFDERLCEVGSNPQAWQFKEVYDAATLGFEIVWPHEDCVADDLDELPAEIEYDVMSDDLFAIRFPSHVRVKESYSLFVLPHHTSFFAMSSWSTHEIPIAIPQIIEADWWPGQLRIIFVRRKAKFEKGRPIAQGLIIPRRDISLKEMSKDKKEQLEASWKFVQDNKDQLVTREVEVGNFATQDNLYARLSQLNQSGSLPSQIKVRKNEPSLRLSWR
jgi:hypothetical protein